MSIANRLSWRRAINRHIAPVSAIVGIVVVFLAVMFVDDDVTTLGLISAGLLVMQAGVWYMANPLLTSERKNTALRSEVDAFIGLVRALDQHAARADASEELEQVRASMHASVDRMTELAGAPAQTDDKIETDKIETAKSVAKG